MEDYFVRVYVFGNRSKKNKVMEFSRCEDEESVKTYTSKYTSDHGLISTCAIPCQCLKKLDTPTPSRKFGLNEHVLGIVSSTETYLKERRIPELIRFLLTKLLAESPDRPCAHLIQILDDCMLYRAGFGRLPVLFEERFVIMSFA